ncbi:MAG: nickel-dependent hydrogenase large subunit [Planctomycetota bacterium]|jgi:hydrogenase large subunit
MSKITIDPVTRIEGHLRVDVEERDGRIAEAHCGGTMARGLELIFRGRDPRDIPILAQRICGVCPQAHDSASAMAMDEAFGLSDQVPPNGRLLRDIMLATNFLQSHILHFYHLAALDYVDVTAAADYDGDDPDLRSVRNFIGRGVLEPFLPRYEGDYRLSPEQNLAAVKHYVRALDVRKNCHEMLALFGGKMPHQCTVAVGGVTTQVSADKMAAALAYAREVAEFVEQCYLPDVLMVAAAYSDCAAIGRGCSRFLSYGVFEEEGLFEPGLLDADGNLKPLSAEKITEDVANSYYADSCDGLHPSEGDTVPQPGKAGAYSWLKAPRYGGQPCEVGPLARMMVNHARGSGEVKEAVDDLCEKAGLAPEALNSTLGRHAARALETALLAGKVQDWILKLQPGEPCVLKVDVPEEGTGAGMTDAPRGALGHWVTIKDGKVANYQAVVPTTWNGSPRDSRGVPGPIEQALEGDRLQDVENPFEVVRTIRSFDPCLACSVHVSWPRGARRFILPV